MIISKKITCKEGHIFTAELDLTNNRYRNLTESEVWHDVNAIIKNGQISITKNFPWCCSRQAYMEFMKQRKQQNRKHS